jgi:hypothetical protein
MVPATKFLQIVGDDAIETITVMQHGHLAVTPGLMRCLESFAIPADYFEFASKVRGIEGKVTASLVKSIASDILRRRWWDWVILHPDLCKEGLVHPTRRMSLSSLTTIYINLSDSI